jgi:hypothetical protein
VPDAPFGTYLLEIATVAGMREREFCGQPFV